MLSSSTKEQKNIPISISLLHEQEYNNLCLIYKCINKSEKRRAFSETNKEKFNKNNKDFIYSKSPLNLKN